MKNRLCGAGAFIVLASALSVFGYNDETMAFYPFDDGPVGSEIGKVTNAVNAALYVGTAKLSTTGAGPSDVELPKPVFSDDIPGKYLFDGATATTPYVSNYGSVWLSKENFGLNYPGYDQTTTNQYGYMSPAVRGPNNIQRVWGSGSIVFAGLNEAINSVDGDGDWTIEFFMKCELPAADQCVFNMTNEKNEGTNGVSFYCPNSQEGTATLRTKDAYYKDSRDNWRKDITTYNISWNSQSRDVNHAIGKDGYWRHVALRHRGGTANTVSCLLNYRTSGGEVPYANYLPGIADSILGDYRSSYPGNPFFGKIAALRVTKRYLEVPELLYASDSADPSTDRVLLHVRVDELPDGEPVTLLKGKSRDTADGVMSYLGINDASTKMSSSAVIPRKNVLYSGSERVGENAGSLKTFVTDGEGVDKHPTCSYRWAANGGVNARIAERGFTVETFFCLSSLDPEEATREEVDVFHVDTSDNANGFATGFRSTGSHFFAWYPSYKEDGTVEDRTYVWVSFADKNLSPPTDKKWHHLALSWDESAKKLRHYYDYTLVYEAECPYGVPLKLTAFQVGSNSFVRRLLGWLDEFRVTAAPLGPEDFLRFRSDLGQIMIIR